MLQRIQEISKRILFIFTIVLIVAFIVITGILYKYPQTAITFIQNRFIPQPIVQTNKLIGLGILGDSQSDEYRADDNRGANFPSTTQNWVEILANERNVNVGEWGIWNEPRRSGYAYNWARTGATAASMIESGQHIGLAQQVKNGEVNVVVIYIGANDFSPYITEDGYEAIYNETLSEAQIERKINRFIADVTTAINVIQAAGDVQILLVTIPDWGNHIGIKLAFPLPYKRILVKRVIDETNQRLEKVALEKGIPTVDPNVFFAELTKETPSSKPIIGGTNLEFLYLNNSPENVFLSDGVHTGTAMNGLFANYLLQVLNPYLSTPISPLTDEEILKISGLD